MNSVRDKIKVAEMNQNSKEWQLGTTGKKCRRRKEERNKAVYTAAFVAGGWAGAVLSWAQAVMSWAQAVKTVRTLKVKA